MGSEGPNEAGLVRLPDSRLFCIFRTGNGDYMGGTWSSDDGKTWSPPISTGFKGVAPHLRLMSNGLLVCTFGRPGVTVMFSPDEGKSWAAVTPIFKGKSTGYTDVIEVGPGKLFVVYDSLPPGGNPVPGTDTFQDMPFTELSSRFKSDEDALDSTGSARRLADRCPEFHAGHIPTYRYGS